jgi:hypothetical protein
MKIYIYGLRCPITGDIRYIGKSVNPAKRRLHHLGAAARGEYSGNYVVDKSAGAVILG